MVQSSHNGKGAYYREHCEYPEEHSEHALLSILSSAALGGPFLQRGLRFAPVLQGSGLSVTMPGGGTCPGEEVRDGSHGDNRCGGNRGGIAPTAAPLRPQVGPGLSGSGPQLERREMDKEIRERIERLSPEARALFWEVEQ